MCSQLTSIATKLLAPELAMRANANAVSDAHGDWKECQQRELPSEGGWERGNHCQHSKGASGDRHEPTTARRTAFRTTQLRAIWKLPRRGQLRAIWTGLDLGRKRPGEEDDGPISIRNFSARHRGPLNFSGQVVHGQLLDLLHDTAFTNGAL